MNEEDQLKIKLFDTIMEMDKARERLAKLDAERGKLFAQYNALVNRRTEA